MMQMHDFFSDLVPSLKGVTGVAGVTTDARAAFSKQIEKDEVRHTFREGRVAAPTFSLSHVTPLFPSGETKQERREHVDFSDPPLSATPVTPVTPDFGLSVEEWREEYEERAAILEFDGGYLRKEAEWHAMNALLLRYTEHCNVSVPSNFVNAICAATRLYSNQGDHHASNR